MSLTLWCLEQRQRPRNLIVYYVQLGEETCRPLFSLPDFKSDKAFVTSLFTASNESETTQMPSPTHRVPADVWG